MEQTDYDKQAESFLQKTNTLFSVKFLKNDLYFADDKEARDIYEITLERNDRRYTFKFGQSIKCSELREKPSAYDVLSCLTKSDVGTFEDFCSEFGYDTDSRKAEKTYKAVVDEYNNLKRLYSDEQLSELQEIQ
jgi:hypothetical protein